MCKELSTSEADELWALGLDPNAEATRESIVLIVRALMAKTAVPSNVFVVDTATGCAAPFGGDIGDRFLEWGGRVGTACLWALGLAFASLLATHLNNKWVDAGYHPLPIGGVAPVSRTGEKEPSRPSSIHDAQESRGFSRPTAHRTSNRRVPEFLDQFESS